MIPALETVDDDTLIRRAIAGETDCFTALVRRHLGTLKNHVRFMLRNPTDADDLIQEVLLKIWLHLPEFRFESSFRAWATRIATNEVLQSYRRQRRNRICQPQEDLEHIPSRAESPMENAVRHEREQAIRSAISRLPTTYRKILRLRYVQEWSERETAYSLQSSIAAVRTRSFRARQMLRTSLRVRFDIRDRSNRPARQDAGRP